MGYFNIGDLFYNKQDMISLSGDKISESTILMLVSDDDRYFTLKDMSTNRVFRVDKFYTEDLINIQDCYCMIRNNYKGSGNVIELSRIFVRYSNIRKSIFEMILIMFVLMPVLLIFIFFISFSILDNNIDLFSISVATALFCEILGVVYLLLCRSVLRKLKKSDYFDVAFRIYKCKKRK